jgi:hypothetical protein
VERDLHSGKLNIKDVWDIRSTRLIDDDSITGDTGQNVPVETQNLSRVECLINPWDIRDYLPLQPLLLCGLCIWPELPRVLSVVIESIRA